MPWYAYPYSYVFNDDTSLHSDLGTNVNEPINALNKVNDVIQIEILEARVCK